MRASAVKHRKMNAQLVRLGNLRLLLVPMNVPTARPANTLLQPLPWPATHAAPTLTLLQAARIATAMRATRASMGNVPHATLAPTRRLLDPQNVPTAMPANSQLKMLLCLALLVDQTQILGSAAPHVSVMWGTLGLLMLVLPVLREHTRVRQGLPPAANAQPAPTLSKQPPLSVPIARQTQCHTLDRVPVTATLGTLASLSNA